MFHHKKAEITDVNQLKGKKLIVVKGTTAETYFSNKGLDGDEVLGFNYLRSDKKKKMDNLLCHHY